MKRLSFFQAAAGPIDLAAAAAIAGAQLVDAAAASIVVAAVAPLDRAGRDEISVFFDALDLDDLRFTRAGACLLPPEHLPHLPVTTVALVTAAPREALHRLAAVLHPSSLRPGSAVGATGIDPSARVAGSARLEPGVIVDPGAVIGPDAEIGAGSFVGALSVIGAGVRIGRDCAIGAGVVVVHALLGDRVVVQAGARLGHRGGGEAGTGEGPSLGRVVVQNDVEIGVDAIVPRGRLSDTVIGEGSYLRPRAAVAEGAIIVRGRSEG